MRRLEMKTGNLILLLLHLLIAGVAAQSSLAEAVTEIPSCAVSWLSSHVLQFLFMLTCIYLADLPDHGHIEFAMHSNRFALHMLECEAQC